MKIETTEGIVLKTTPYQDHKRIVTLFTEEGLLTLMATVYPKHSHALLLTSPSCVAEFCYQRNASDLHFLKEGSIISSHLRYNTSYARLETAFAFLQTLLLSQMPAKPAPLLYQLCKYYLEHLPHVAHPKNLASSFTLKLLRHEGLLPLEGLCSKCHLHPSDAFFQGEAYCQNCRPKESLSFEPQEWECLQTFLFSKELKTIDGLKPSETFHQKIHQLFQQQLIK